MKLILLGGISFKNKAWIEEVAAELKTSFGAQIMYYDHWETGGEEMDFGVEGAKLEKVCSRLDNFGVLAKSGGSWLTLKLAAEGKIKPVRMILIGPAWNWARNNGFESVELAKKVKAPVLVIDKTCDPALPFNQLEREVKEAGLDNFKLAELPGDTHHYEDVIRLREVV